MQARRPDKVDFVAGAHEAVIDSATWQAYVAKRAEAGAPRNKAPVHKYSRLTFCDSCGRRLVAHTRSSGRRFWCDNGAASQRTTEPCAAPVSIEEYKLDKVVLSWLRDHASGKNAFQDALDRASKAQRVKVDLEGIDADIERQKRRLARLTDILLDADEDDEDARETFRERQGEIRSELKRLRAQRDALAAEANTVEAPSAEAIEALLRVWDKGDVQMVNEALRAVIAEIHIVRAERGKWDEPTARVKITPVWGI